MLFHWLRTRAQTLKPRTRGTARRAFRSRPLGLEVLEDRTVPSTTGLLLFPGSSSAGDVVGDPVIVGASNGNFQSLIGNPKTLLAGGNYSFTDVQGPGFSMLTQVAKDGSLFKDVNLLVLNNAQTTVFTLKDVSITSVTTSAKGDSFTVHYQSVSESTGVVKQVPTPMQGTKGAQSKSAPQPSSKNGPTAGGTPTTVGYDISNVPPSSPPQNNPPTAGSPTQVGYDISNVPPSSPPQNNPPTAGSPTQVGYDISKVPLTPIPLKTESNQPKTPVQPGSQKGSPKGGAATNGGFNITSIPTPETTKVTQPKTPVQPWSQKGSPKGGTLTATGYDITKNQSNLNKDGQPNSVTQPGTEKGTTKGGTPGTVGYDITNNPSNPPPPSTPTSHYDIVTQPGTPTNPPALPAPGNLGYDIIPMSSTPASQPTKNNTTVHYDQVGQGGTPPGQAPAGQPMPAFFSVTALEALGLVQNPFRI
jgi:hypothetical protein